MTAASLPAALPEAAALRLPLKGFAVSALASAIRLVLQLGQLLLVARTLGPAGFGEIVALVGLCTALSALAGWGGATLYVRDLPRLGADAAQGLAARALWMFVPSALLVAVVAALADRLWLGGAMPWRAVALVVTADLVFATAVQLGMKLLHAHDRHGRALLLEMVFAASRLAAALLLVWQGGTDPADWAGLYCGASALAAAIGLVLVGVPTGRPRWVGGEWRDGLALAAGGGAQMARRSLDRPVSLAVLGPELAGVHGLAARLVEAALLPLFAVLRVTHRRIFGAAAGGPGALRRLVLRLVPLLGGLGALAALGLVALSFAVEPVLGPAYAGAAPVLVGLAALPALNALSALGGDVLAARGRAGLRVGIEGLGVCLKIGLALWLAGAHGLPGLIAGVVLADLAVTVVIGGCAALAMARGDA